MSLGFATPKSTTKAVRRAREKGAVIQLARIEEHLAGFMQGGESPAMAMKRLLQEVQKLRAEKENRETITVATERQKG